MDTEALLEPISEEHPTGIDIREDRSPSSPYQSIKDARNSARSAERHSVFDGGSSEADENWRRIYTLAPEILQQHAKDLEVAAWYTEALIRREGYAGLSKGFTAIRELIERYWDELYPFPDEDGLETRVAPLTGLNGEGAEGVLIAPIRNANITEGEDPGPYTLWQYKQALEINKLSDEAGRKSKQGKLGFTLEDIERSAAQSSEAFFVNLRDALVTSIAEYKTIRQLLDERCGSEISPPTSNIITALEDALSIVRHLGRFKLPQETAEPEGEGEGEEQAATGVETTQPGDAPFAAGPPRSREAAFKQLNTIADFFRDTEPHSPISYAIDKAIRWGDMPLDKLIQELIPDASSRKLYGSLTGVTSDDE